MPWIENRFEEGLIVTSMDYFINWSRSNSLWPLSFGLACCAIEMMAVGGGRFDIARFGSEKFSATPRQADLMIVAGTVTCKMAERVKRLYDQMADPKYVIAMGACTIGGGPYFKVESDGHVTNQIGHTYTPGPLGATISSTARVAVESLEVWQLADA